VKSYPLEQIIGRAGINVRTWSPTLWIPDGLIESPRKTWSFTNVEIEADGLPITDERVVSLTQMLRAEFQACGEELSDIYAESVLPITRHHLLGDHSNYALKTTCT
jgi:hypothetical protein